MQAGTWSQTAFLTAPDFNVDDAFGEAAQCTETAKLATEDHLAQLESAVNGRIDEVDTAVATLAALVWAAVIILHRLDLAGQGSDVIELTRVGPNQAGPAAAASAIRDGRVHGF